ncbi:hypothetical protein [Dactylosporangium sp. CA-139066]|uniref:hypothetical protein n=1 Tax=Dactylosporangium sp. CA-139066 TaxID=3239930 RepID=UPI003D9070FB
MNFIQRLVTRWWSVWAAIVGLDTSRLETELPAPLVDPRISATTLIAEAEARGAQDAGAKATDSWMYGWPNQPPSAEFDPDYVHELRRRRDAAVAALFDAQRQTESRISNVRNMRDEQERRMNDARVRMSGLAVRDRALEALRIDELDDDAALPPDPQGADEDTPWEGETDPLPLGWRLLILAGLIAAELPVQFYVFGYFLGDRALGRWMAVVTAAVVVFAPFIAGALMRNRQASTAERRVLHAVIVLAAGWLLVVAVLGFVRGTILEQGSPDPGRHITPATVVLLFVALLVVVGTMAFMLGLARRHPFQEAYVRHRNRRDRFDTLMRGMAARLNPGYYDPDTGAVTVDDTARAIREAYAAAEEAYFAALTRAVGDPTFTEAVQQRRGLRGTA